MDYVYIYFKDTERFIQSKIVEEEECKSIDKRISIMIQTIILIMLINLQLNKLKRIIQMMLNLKLNFKECIIKFHLKKVVE